MSKELEALEEIKNYIEDNITTKHNHIEPEIEIVKQALQRLEAIDNANPSEALNYLDRFINEMTYCLENPKQYAKGYEKEIFYKYKNTFETTIKQSLINAQEQEKVLEILFEKEVDIFVLKIATSVEHYNKTQKLEQYHLTEEEFGLLKRWIGNGN